MPKILLSGYYGFDNAGDEAVLYAIIQSLSKAIPDGEITVLSNHPQRTTALYQVRAVDRWDKKTIYREIKNCDLLISGGGSLLQDVTSKNGILYYLGLIQLAKMLGKKVLIYAQGIGPIQHKRNRKLTARILNKVQGITVRDFLSREELIEMGVTREIQVVVDPVLGISNESISVKAGKRVLERAGLTGEGPIAMVSVRLWKNSQHSYEQLASCCDQMIEQGWQVLFVPMHFPGDFQAGQLVAAAMKHSAIMLEERFTVQETLEIYKQADLIIGMRLHALIMGVTLHKPIVALSYDPKVERFMQSLKLEQWLPVENFTAEQLYETIMNTWTSKEAYLEKLLWRMDIIEEQAQIPTEIAKDLL